MCVRSFYTLPPEKIGTVKPEKRDGAKLERRAGRSAEKQTTTKKRIYGDIRKRKDRRKKALGDQEEKGGSHSQFRVASCVFRIM